MSSHHHYDVIVIGSGPGGASMAQKLAVTGKRILLLERSNTHLSEWCKRGINADVLGG